MARFDRVCSLLVGPAGGRGFEITNLRIKFEITKDTDRNPNKSTIQIYNLQPSSRAAIEKPDVRCVLKAGYAEENGPLECYNGNVIFSWTAKEGPDIITTLELGDGAVAFRDGVVSIGYGAGVTSRQILEQIASRMGLTLQMPGDAPSRTWANGFSSHGAARSALDRVTRGAGLSWSIQNGVLQVVRVGGTTNRTVFELAVDTGLLGSPERQRKGAGSAITTTDQATRTRRRAASATERWDGWRVKSLILPTLLPNDRVKLKSAYAEGVMRIKEIRHIGDTHDGDWVSELTLVDPSLSPNDRRGERPAPSGQVRQSNPGGGLPTPPIPPSAASNGTG